MLVAEGMSLREQLRMKAWDTLPYFDGALCLREPVLLWDEKDEAAARLCGQVVSSPFGSLLESRSAGGSGRSLGTVLKSLRRQNMAEDFSCPEGFYLLWVSSGPQPEGFLPELEKVRASGVPMVLDVCIVSGEPGGPGQPGEGFRYLWQIAPGRVETLSTLAALLAAGAFLREPVIAPEDTGRGFWVWSVMHNSVERDLAFRLQDCLKAILFGGSEDWRERFRNEFGLPGRERKRIMQAIPRPEDLPVTGDPEALPQPDRGNSRGILQTWFRRGTEVSGTERGSGMTVGDALNYFFGKTGGRCTPEWLLEQLPQILPGHCSACMADMQLERQCWRLPLHFLLHSAAQYTEELHANALARFQEERRQCEDAMLHMFSPPGSRLEQLMDGLADYREKWEVCLECALEAAWWDAVKGLVCSQTMKQAAQRKWDELQSDLAAIRPAAARRRPKASYSVSTDWRASSSPGILAGLSSRVEFRDEDLAALIQDIQIRSDKAVDVRRFRQTVLFADLDQIPRLERLRDDRGKPLLVADEKGGLLGLSNTSKPKVAGIPSLGPYTLWEVRFDADPVQTGGGQND